MNGGPNIGQMTPLSTLSCEHFVPVALPRSSALRVSYHAPSSNKSWDKGVAGAKLAVWCRTYWCRTRFNKRNQPYLQEKSLVTVKLDYGGG